METATSKATVPERSGTAPTVLSPTHHNHTRGNEDGVPGVWIILSCAHKSSASISEQILDARWGEEGEGQEEECLSKNRQGEVRKP